MNEPAVQSVVGRMERDEMLRRADDLHLLAVATRDNAQRAEQRRLDAKWSWWGRLEGERICGVAMRVLGGGLHRVWWLPPPNRHNDVIREMGSAFTDNNVEQGFVVSSRFAAPYFVGRIQAYEIARAAGQLCSPAHPGPHTLFSEDVW